MLQSISVGAALAYTRTHDFLPVMMQFRNVGAAWPPSTMPSPPLDLMMQFSINGLTRSSPSTRTDSLNPVKSISRFCITHDRLIRNSGLLFRQSTTASLSAPSPRIMTRLLISTTSPSPLCAPRKSKIRSPSCAMSTASRKDFACIGLLSTPSPLSPPLPLANMGSTASSSSSSNAAFVGASLPSHASSPALRTKMSLPSNPAMEPSSAAAMAMSSKTSLNDLLKFFSASSRLSP
mmetsp:Transcript_7439/g.27138  ORF Transcript_7439/g.27138 Transcript_7439/m.27138 type:complete len:235 (-) Transcript_7439:604-1308(-)